MATPSIGFCFDRAQPAADVIDYARLLDEAGVDELWVIEDCFYTTGVTLAAAALTATERLRVGIGIMPAAVRNPAMTAMEITTLDALGGGRLLPGLGHGVAEWMAQIGEHPRSPLTLLEETTSIVRSLLAGETVSVEGSRWSLDRVVLETPPPKPPPVVLGVRGPKSLELAGRVADGTILADFPGPSYIRWARERIAEGRAASASTAPAPAPHHRLTAFCSLSLGADANVGRAQLAPALAGALANPPRSVIETPFFTELQAMVAERGPLAAAQQMPAEWWRELAAVGTIDDAVRFVHDAAEAGADTVSFFVDPDTAMADTRRAIDELLPELHRAVA